jgi:galactokinase
LTFDEPMLSALLDKWHYAFGINSPAIIVRAPGRVNIIGEHTDYNHGWVLPGAMNRSLYVLISKSHNNTNHWIADDLNEEVITNHTSVLPLWAKYIEGGISFYSPDIGPLNILISGDLPVGAGISSSSALVCGVLVALQEMTSGHASKETLALLGSKIEREVIGVQGGIMDQFAIMLSQPNHVMLLDCRSKAYQPIEVQLEGCQWMLINTRVKHNLIDSDYNQRAEECKGAVTIIQSGLPAVDSLRDVTIEQLTAVDLPETLFRRAKFVIEENDRVLKMVKALEDKHALEAGRLLAASHEGLKSVYEVSCDELDHLADFANTYKGVFGARMMGGGFGGCVICLLKENVVADFITRCEISYKERFGFSPEFIPFVLGPGAERIQ